MPPKPMEVYRQLLKEGWCEKSRKGSHCKLVRDAKVIILPIHRKELSRGIYDSICKQAGWK